MYWHIDTDIVSLIVILILCVYNARLLPSHGSAVRSRRFLVCLWAGVFGTVIDIAASVVMEIPGRSWVYHLLMMLNFGMLELLIVVWLNYSVAVMYHDAPARMRTATRAVMAPYALYLLLLFSNPHTGLFYTLGPNNAYQRGPCFMLMVALFAAYALALFIMVMLRKKHLPFGYPSRLLWMMPAILSVAIAVQLSVPGWLTVLPSYMICLVLASLFLQTLRIKSREELVQTLSVTAATDPLTGLYNRIGLEERIRILQAKHHGRRCLAAMVDVDDLKAINDTMGHADGDLALKAVAKQLKSHFRATDIVARFGGDEFLVFLTGELSESQARLSLCRLLAELSALSVDGRFFVRCSVGAAMGIIGTDDYETLCRHADKALYHVKRSGKNGYALYAPDMEAVQQSL